MNCLRMGWLLLAVGLAGCAAMVTPVTSDTVPQDAAQDTRTDVATVPCGTESCTGGQVCVQPCCGGAQPPCVRDPVNGPCPAGSVLGLCTRDGMPSMGCAIQCTPPAAFCAPSPAEGACMGNTCPVCPSRSGVRMGATVRCMCA
ncbi:MAG: hypothetical protein Q8Q09_00250 [Deltaproteobacteria bacterium]|nr:hypothetical protein [Deltaproteobacteria bacterium]